MIYINPVEDEKLPVEYPIKTAVGIYFRRLSVFLAVVSGNLFLLGVALGMASLFVPGPFPAEVMARVVVAASVALVPYVLLQGWGHYG